MSRYSVNISNIVFTQEQYQKLQIYAADQKISIHEAIRLLIDSLPDWDNTINDLKNNHSLLSRKK